MQRHTKSTTPIQTIQVIVNEYLPGTTSLVTERLLQLFLLRSQAINHHLSTVYLTLSSCQRSRSYKNSIIYQLKLKANHLYDQKLWSITETYAIAEYSL